MRIASLLPSATEIAFALGLGDAVVGVSHECDYPIGVRGLPVLTRSAVNTAGRSQREIDDAIAALLRDGGSTYTLDLPLLQQLQPDLVLTQALCDVCAVSEGAVHRAAHEAALGVQILSLTPRTLDEVLATIEEVGAATDTQAAAQQITHALRDRLAAVRALVAGRPRSRVLALEWLDPPFIAGHWVPDQIVAAGGIGVLGRAGEPSYRTTWDAIAGLNAEAQPDVVLILPCGARLDEVVRDATLLQEIPAWRSLMAVRAGAVWAVDASAWFSRPGPRVIDGLEALATILADPFGAALPGTVRLDRFTEALA